MLHLVQIESYTNCVIIKIIIIIDRIKEIKRWFSPWTRSLILAKHHPALPTLPLHHDDMTLIRSLFFFFSLHGCFFSSFHDSSGILGEQSTQAGDGAEGRQAVGGKGWGGGGGGGGEGAGDADSLWCGGFGGAEGHWIICCLIECFLRLMSLPPQWSSLPSSASSPSLRIGGRGAAEEAWRQTRGDRSSEVTQEETEQKGHGCWRKGLCWVSDCREERLTGEDFSFGVQTQHETGRLMLLDHWGQYLFVDWPVYIQSMILTEWPIHYLEFHIEPTRNKMTAEVLLK